MQSANIFHRYRQMLTNILVKKTIKNIYTGLNKKKVC